MSKTKRYDKEFKVMLVELMLSGQRAEDLGKEYGNRVRSRLREMFNLVSFDETSIDKRN